MSADLADLALETARAAASLIRERAADGVRVAATKTSDVDVVTEADQASERLIRDRIRAQRPDDAFLGEEGEDEPGTSGVRWIIDPIDGTVNFLYGLGQFAVSIAAERDGIVVAGVVLEVTHGVEYVATRNREGATATRNGSPLSVREPAVMAQRLIATGFSYDQEVRRRQGEALARLIPQVRDIRRMGSCALDLCLVAQGALDGYVEEGVHRWDYAAAALVAEASGARCTLRRGASGLDLLVCAPTQGFDEFDRLLDECGYGAKGGE